MSNIIVLKFLDPLNHELLRRVSANGLLKKPRRCSMLNSTALPPPTGERGAPITIIQKHENIVQLDGREIAREVAPEVKEIIDADKDRNRSNANDKPLMGND